MKKQKTSASADLLAFIITIVLLLIFTAMCSSCKAPRQSVTEKHYRSDSTIVKYEPVTIEIPGSEVKETLPPNFYDSLVHALKARPPDQRVIYRTDPGMQTKLSFFLDSLGQLQARCETLERQYSDTLQHVYRLIKEMHAKETETVKQPGFFKRIFNDIGKFVLILILLAIIFLLLINKFKKS